MKSKGYEMIHKHDIGGDGVDLVFEPTENTWDDDYAAVNPDFFIQQRKGCIGINRCISSQHDGEYCVTVTVNKIVQSAATYNKLS